MTSLDSLARTWSLDGDALARVGDRFPFRISRHYAGLIRAVGDPIWLQAVPDPAELGDEAGWDDPLAEESLSPVPNLVHRYPNRVLWLVSHECAVHCRFCTRKRRWKKPLPLTEESFQAGLDYIKGHQGVTDVLLSGGDPLLLPTSRLESILASLRKIAHVQIIRIGTRIPCVFPQMITPELTGMLARYHPLYMNLHFNHPIEITKESSGACSRLASAGIPLGSQTVLLSGVNDDIAVLGELFRGLLTMRVRPYYLMQMDLTRGTAHFRTPISKGLEMIQGLRNFISGLAIPHFVIDLPQGRGKIPLIPNHVEGLSEEFLIVRDYQGGLCKYPLLSGEKGTLRRWFNRQVRVSRNMG